MSDGAKERRIGHMECGHDTTGYGRWTVPGSVRKGSYTICWAMGCLQFRRIISTTGAKDG